jgi:hypothetical protein
MGTSGYDEVNNRLGIGTATPAYPLHSTGQAHITNRLSLTDTGVDYGMEGFAWVLNASQVVSITSPTIAIVFLINSTDGTVAIFEMRGDIHTTNKIADIAGGFSATGGTPNSINLYYSSGYKIENGFGSAKTVYGFFVGKIR